MKQLKGVPMVSAMAANKLLLQTCVCWDSLEATLAKTELAYKEPRAEIVEEGKRFALPPWSPATAGCWVGSEGDCFATGHENGEIMLWGVPDSAPSFSLSGMLFNTAANAKPDTTIVT